MENVIYIAKPSKATLANYRKQGAKIERIELDWVKITLRGQGHEVQRDPEPAQGHEVQD